MTYAILSMDIDRVQDMTKLLIGAGGEMQWASSWTECARAARRLLWKCIMTAAMLTAHIGLLSRARDSLKIGDSY
jgi:hypothetical protein